MRSPSSSSSSSSSSPSGSTSTSTSTSPSTSTSVSTTASATHEPLWTKNFVILFFANLMIFIGFQMLNTTMPVYIATFTTSSSEVGVVIGALTLAAVISRPFSGAASDILGRKKILTIGIILCFIAIISYYVALTIAIMIVVRIIHGIGWGASPSMFGTIASDIVPATRRGEGLGYFGYASMLAGAVGPMTGLWLLNHVNNQAVIALAAVCTLLSIMALFFVKAPEIVHTASAKQEASFYSRLIEKSSVYPSFLMLILGVVFGGIITFIALYGSEKGIANVGWFFLINALFSFIVRLFSGKIFDKKGHIYVIIPGIIATFIAVLLLSFVSSTLSLCVSGAFYGIGMGILQPSFLAWTINRAAPERRGAANSTFFTAFDLGCGGGGMLLGAVAKATDYASMYRFSCLFLVLLLILYLIPVAKKTWKPRN